MALKVETHIIGHENKCARCGGDLRKVMIPITTPKLRRGDRIGVISGLSFLDDSGYVITNPDTDSNQLCKI